MTDSLLLVTRLLTDGRCNDVCEFPWHTLEYAHVNAVRTVLATKYKPATGNRVMAALKRVLKECQRLDLMTSDQYLKAVDVKPISGVTVMSGRALSKSELKGLMEAALSDTSITGVRDAAVLGILRVGLRRAEVVGLELRDFDFGEGSLFIRHGKGNKERIVYLPQGAIASISNWVEVRGREAGPLLMPISNGKNVVRRKLTADAVYQILKKLAGMAKIESFSPHDFRRTFAGDLLDAGVDIVTVQKLMGHASVETTGRYDRRGEGVKKKAVSFLE